MNRRALFRAIGAAVGVVALPPEPIIEVPRRVFSFAKELRVPGIDDGGIYVCNTSRGVRIVSTYEEMCEAMGWAPMRNSRLRELFEPVVPTFVPIGVGLMAAIAETRMRAAMRAFGGERSGAKETT